MGAIHQLSTNNTVVCLYGPSAFSCEPSVVAREDVAHPKPWTLTPKPYSCTTYLWTPPKPLKIAPKSLEIHKHVIQDPHNLGFRV